MAPPTSTDTIEVTNNEKESRFEASSLEGLAYLRYRRHADGTLDADPHGGAAGTRRARIGVSTRPHRARTWRAPAACKVIVRCPFVTEYIARHPEYHDLVHERSMPKSS